MVKMVLGVERVFDREMIVKMIMKIVCRGNSMMSCLAVAVLVLVFGICVPEVQVHNGLPISTYTKCFNPCFPSQHHQNQSDQS